jgi:EAL domain-containing protein (putative c-di-GMP-specific phosphodiesterase class I)
MFEITESIVAEDINRVILVMDQLKASGIRFSMDDFGTGYSSLSNLNRLPLDEIKIDRAFISALSHHDGDRAMVTTILKMASILKLSTVAEGVETEAQIEFLMQHDCPVFQGYFYSKPLPSDQFVAFYKGRQ